VNTQHRINPMRHALAFLCLWAALPALAQDLVFSTAAVDQCLATGATDACIGLSAEACQRDTPGGGSTLGMTGCLDRERAYWDGALNYYYQDLRTRDPDRADALRDTQRAWIVWRDATCAYEAADYAGGTLAGVVTLDCLLRQTARQTLFLRAIHTDVLQR
jgi:uncharacterized protein YecT (DUF1311 family)